MREGKERKGIIIVEHDDFLREILGNLLHKVGYYIVSGESITSVRGKLSQHSFHLAIVGENVKDFYGRKTIQDIQRETGNNHIAFFLITENGTNPLVEAKNQIDVSRLSIRKILNHTRTLLR